MGCLLIRGGGEGRRVLLNLSLLTLLLEEELIRVRLLMSVHRSWLLVLLLLRRSEGGGGVELRRVGGGAGGRTAEMVDVWGGRRRVGILIRRRDRVGSLLVLLVTVSRLISLVEGVNRRRRARMVSEIRRESRISSSNFLSRHVCSLVVVERVARWVWRV